MNILTKFLESLKQTTESISESTANKKSSESLEDTLQKVLINNGLLDLTADLELCHKGEINYFSNATTKSARKTQWGVIKNYINDYGPSDQQTLRTDLNGMFPANCFQKHLATLETHINVSLCFQGCQMILHTSWHETVCKSATTIIYIFPQYIFCQKIALFTVEA